MELHQRERPCQRIRLEVHRCPYCHDAVPRPERALCAGCLAVHHAACWGELRRCATCGEGVPLVPAGRQADPGFDALHDACELGEACRISGLLPPELERLVARGSLGSWREGERILFRRSELVALRARIDPRATWRHGRPLPARARGQLGVALLALLLCATLPSPWSWTAVAALVWLLVMRSVRGAPARQ